MLERWKGVYRLDPANTARLMADSFRDRFVMKEGCDQAITAFFAEDDPEVEQIRLLVDEDSICLVNEFDSDRFPITRCWDDGGQWFVEILWEGRPERFELQEFDGECLRLQNPSNSLSEYVWRRIGVDSLNTGDSTP